MSEWESDNYLIAQMTTEGNSGTPHASEPIPKGMYLDTDGEVL
jgi:hypothetical protein